MSPLGFRGDVSLARRAVVEALEELGGRVLVHENDREQEKYVRASFESGLFGFIDDVEIWLDPDAARVDFRSASRVGYSDLGANRRRMLRLSRDLTQKNNFFLLPDDG